MCSGTQRWFSRSSASSWTTYPSRGREDAAADLAGAQVADVPEGDPGADVVAAQGRADLLGETSDRVVVARAGVLSRTSARAGYPRDIMSASAKATPSSSLLAVT